MDAKEYDESGARRKKVRIVGVVVALLVVGFLAYQFRYWPEERLAVWDHHMVERDGRFAAGQQS